MKELSQPKQIKEYEALLSSLIDNFVEEDRSYREHRMREWKKLDLYWHSLFYFFWDAEKGDFNLNITDSDDDIDVNRAANIYKAHGESIISAVSSSFPHVVFFPADADNADDITAARAKTSLAKLIRKHNGLDLLLLHSAFILFNQDFVACWNRNVTDKKYGIFKTSTILEEDFPDENCEECGSVLEEGYCAECNEFSGESSEKEGFFEEEKEAGRSRQILEIFGPRQVQISNYAKKMANTPFLVLRRDFSPAELKWKYQEFAELIEANTDDSQEYWARSPYNTYSDSESSTAVHTIVWLRPWALGNVSKDHEKLANKLLKEFPTGLRIELVNEMIVKIKEEDLDDFWTISKSPFSDTLHGDPIGRPLVDLQEMVNDVLNFTVDTIGHGVGETFVDPTVLDSEQYKDGYHRPGDITGVKARPQENLSNSFYQNKPAQLSGEIDNFSQYLETMSQLVSGSFPSIYGGKLEGSRTASEYAQSRQQALQRLGSTYKVLKRFVLEMMDRAVTNFAKNMSEKENFVIRNGSNFINNWIYKSELSGETGEVDIEGGEELPVSWTRIRDTVFELMQNQNPLIQAIFADPQNVTILKNIIGIPELILPGETSRDKQWAEIAQLVSEEAIDGKTSIPTNYNLDDDQVELTICQYWINSEQGQFARKTNPAGYENVVLHAQEHQKNLIDKQVQAAPEEAGKPKTEELGEKVNG